MSVKQAYSPRKRIPPGSPSAMFAGAISDVGGLKHAAHNLGRSVARVAELANPNASEHQRTVEYALAVTRLGSEGFARTFALEAGGVFVPLKQTKASVHDAVASLTEAAAAVAATTIRALADGRFSPAEAADALRDLDRAAESLVCARARVREAMEATP